MAAEWLTPTDEIIGLPMIILPYDVPAERVDYHHHFYPRRSPELLPQLENPSIVPPPEVMELEDLASMALRMSRGQLLPRSIHELGHKKLLGPILPVTVQDKFVTTVKACAGMVSRWAVDIRRPDDDMLVYMDDDVFAKAADRKLVCTERSYYDRPATYRRQVFGHFFLKYAVSADLDCISSSTIDQFLDTKDENRQRELGNFILKAALSAHIEPVIPLHQKMWKQGNIQPGKPAHVATAVRKLIPQQALPHYYPLLQERLQAA